MVVIMVEQPFCAHEEVNHFPRSCVDHERCTTILVGSSILLSCQLPHSGRDEEDQVEALGAARNVMTEGTMARVTSSPK